MKVSLVSINISCLIELTLTSKLMTLTYKNLMEIALANR